MRTLGTANTAMMLPRCEEGIDEAQVAAVAFLARYTGRTVEAYRHDLRMFFQWAGDRGLEVLQASRPHIELYRAAMEERGLASTIDRRLSTVCGFYRFAHIDGRIPSNRPSTSVDPRCNPVRVTGWTVGSSARSCSPPSGSIATTPRWRCCSD